MRSNHSARVIADDCLGVARAPTAAALLSCMSAMPPKRDTSRTRLVRVRKVVDQRKKDALDRVERERERHGPVRIALGSLELDRRTGGSLLAGGLAYRLFLWLLPYGLFVSSLLRVVTDSGGPTAAGAAKDIGVGTEMVSTIEQASGAAGRNAVWLLLLATFLMFFAARSVLRALSVTSALSWGIRVGPRHSWRATLALAAGLIGLSAYHYVLGPLYAGRLPEDLAATLIAAVGITAAACWGMARLPHSEGIEWQGFLPGAALFGFGIEGLRFVTDFYLAARFDRVDDLYGAVGVAAAFMAVLYLGARLAVGALALNAASWRSGAEAK